MGVVMGRPWRRACVIVLFATVAAVPSVRSQGRGAAPPDAAATAQAVPADLKPLLAPRHSEMRIVANWYEQDRGQLNAYFGGAGGGGGRGGRGGGAAGAATPQMTTVPLSQARIARLKRHDLDWQAAIAAVNPVSLSPEGRTDLDSLTATIRRNLLQLEADTRAIAEVTPLVPFGRGIVDLVEARQRVDPMDAQKAAGRITALTREIAAVRAQLEAGLSGPPGAGAVKPGAELASRAAATTDGLRANLAGWFNFYNGYDPLFTWWMGLPYKKIDGSLQEYSTFLREKVAPAGQGVTDRAVTATPIQPAAPPKPGAVPDLRMLIALPQDEMAPVVQAFTSSQGRGGRAGAAAPSKAFYEQWLAALKTLDFDALSRNAQVDYLYIRKACENALARMAFTPDPNAPRKADNSGIPGPARGRAGLILDLREEMIPYTPEQLIALANREFARQEEEMKKASRAMGLGDNWKAAIERVKDQHGPPGGQPIIIRDMLYEAIDYLRRHDMITVPQVAAETLRMSMMSPERQLVNPFFTGGAQITVSYPTDTMDYDARLQSMRGNATALSHATAHHEMIPGHNLVGYTGSRYGAMYRARIGGGATPFFGEGWPVYWETILFDKGFHHTPEERIGALFWLMHRSARIIFSLNFHMGVWSPQECIDFLVEKVGHERDNATAEVRRSFDPAAGYGPLYQAAYLLGALQLRGLRSELVDSRQMTERAFHDEIMRQGSMPIGLLRLSLTKQKLSRDMNLDWQFYGELPNR